jgi:hypothetical protein
VSAVCAPLVEPVPLVEVLPASEPLAEPLVVPVELLWSLLEVEEVGDEEDEVLLGELLLE